MEAKKKEVKFKVRVTQEGYFNNQRVMPGQKLMVSKSEFSEAWMEDASKPVAQEEEEKVIETEAAPSENDSSTEVI